MTYNENIMVKNIAKEKIKKTSQFKTFLKRLSKNKLAIAGIIQFFILVVLAVLSPVINPYQYDEIDLTSKLQPPSLQHFFGTDQLGRDIFSRILYGGRYSLSLGVISISFALVVAILMGSISGYYGGWVDGLLMRALDVIQPLPQILVAVIMSAVLGPGFITTIIALAVPNIAAYTRLLRAQFLQVSQHEYVEAATSLSLSRFSIMMKHILPNAWQPLIVASTMGIANTVLYAASLSFIGLGIQAPIPEWGAMLSGSRDFMRDYPYMVMIPGVFIMITVLDLNLFGDGIRDALDPKLKD